MKVLLSAYACEPNKGSEPGVGWNWAIEIARLGHEVWVLTRTNNRASIEEEFAQKVDLPQSLNFVYYDLPSSFRFWKKGQHGVHLYYFLWQIGAFFQAKRLSSQIDFDLVHHITFVSFRQPSFMGLLGRPFIFGPVGGGESAPWRLRKSFPLKGFLNDFLRDCANWLVKLDPFMHCTFMTASRIIVTSEQTAKQIPGIYQNKVQRSLAIGIDPSKTSNAVINKKNDDDEFRILYVGNMLYLKGIHLALRAFSDFYHQHPNSKFCLVGSGPDQQWLKNLAYKLGLESAVEWVPWMKQQELIKLYPSYDVFLFPSLHDSGGIVILEAMSNGLPIICLDIGGPGLLVDESSGYKIPVQRQSEQDIILTISNVLHNISTDPDRLKELSTQALSRAKTFSWNTQVKAQYDQIDSP